MCVVTRLTQLHSERDNEGLHRNTTRGGSEELMNDYFSLCNTTGCWFKGYPAPHPLTFYAEYPQQSKLGRGCSAPEWNKTLTLLLDGDLWDLASTWDCKCCLIHARLKQDSYKQVVVFICVDFCILSCSSIIGCYLLCCSCGEFVLVSMCNTTLLQV